MLSWRLSNTLDGRFCLDAQETGLMQGQPEIFNPDQGVQFTAHKFTSRLVVVEAEIRVSMDGRARAGDNVFIERLWRSKFTFTYFHSFVV